MSTPLDPGITASIGFHGISLETQTTGSAGTRSRYPQTAPGVSQQAPYASAGNSSRARVKIILNGGVQ